MTALVPLHSDQSKESGLVKNRLAQLLGGGDLAGTDGLGSANKMCGVSRRCADDMSAPVLDRLKRFGPADPFHLAGKGKLHPVQVGGVQHV